MGPTEKIRGRSLQEDKNAAAPQALQRPTYLGTGTLAGRGSGAMVDSLNDATAGAPGGGHQGGGD